MNKLIKVVGILVLLVLVVVMVAGIFLNSMIKTGVETLGPAITGTTVTLESVDISVFSGQGSVQGLVVGNPKGFNMESAFQLGEAKVDVDLKSILADTVIIREIFIDGPEITFEGSLTGSNLDKIRTNVEAFGGASESTGTRTQGEGSSTSEMKKVRIHKFIVKNGTVNVSTSILQGAAMSVALPEIELRDIGKEEAGATLEQASSRIIEAVYGAIFKAVSGSGALLGDRVEDVQGRVKDIGGDIEGETSKVLEGVKGLFGD